MTQDLIPENRLLTRLRAGGYVFGTMVGTLAQSSMPVLLANAGFEFFILDNEHGMFDSETTETICRVAMAQGITPIVRIADHTYTWVAKSLDAGGQGLLLPRIYSVAQVKAIARMMKFPPLGQRGNALSRAYVGYGAGPVAEVMARANSQSMMVVQIETREAFDLREEIAALPYVDSLFIGPNDLSISLGQPGQLDHPTVVDAIRQTRDTCLKHDKIPGIQMNTPDSACRWAEEGFRLLSAQSDIGLLQSAGQQVVQALCNVTGRDRQSSP